MFKTFKNMIFGFAVSMIEKLKKKTFSLISVGKYFLI